MNYLALGQIASKVAWVSLSYWCQYDILTLMHSLIVNLKVLYEWNSTTEKKESEEIEYNW